MGIFIAVLFGAVHVAGSLLEAMNRDVPAPSSDKWQLAGFTMRWTAMIGLFVIAVGVA